MSDKEEMSSDGGLNVTLTLRLLMHGKVVHTLASTLSPPPHARQRCVNMMAPCGEMWLNLCSPRVAGSWQHHWQGRSARWVTPRRLLGSFFLRRK